MSEKVLTKGDWKKKKAHPVTLPSGAVVEIQIPDLPALIAAGRIPQGLLDVAVKAASGQADTNISPEQMKQQKEFTDQVVLVSVVKPEITEADLDDIPYEDKEMIVQFAMRDRDLDAVGNQLGGLQTNEQFRRFRSLERLDTSLADL